jgi:hypothetical protein
VFEHDIEQLLGASVISKYGELREVFVGMWHGLRMNRWRRPRRSLAWYPGCRCVTTGCHEELCSHEQVCIGSPRRLWGYSASASRPTIRYRLAAMLMFGASGIIRCHVCEAHQGRIHGDSHCTMRTLRVCLRLSGSECMSFDVIGRSGRRPTCLKRTCYGAEWIKRYLPAAIYSWVRCLCRPKQRTTFLTGLES